MADDKASQGKAPETVPVADLLAQKNRAKKAEDALKAKEQELAQALSKNKKLEADLKVAKTDVEDDEEVKKIRASLIEEFDKLKAEQETHQKDLTSFTEREKKVRASELVAQAKTQYGVDIKVEDIIGSDNMDAEVNRHCLDTLAKQKAETPPAGSVYESGSGGIAKKGIPDMSDKEFADYVAKQTKEALSKK